MSGFLNNCQGVPYKAENWHALSQEQYFSINRFSDICQCAFTKSTSAHLLLVDELHKCWESSFVSSWMVQSGATLIQRVDVTDSAAVNYRPICELLESTQLLLEEHKDRRHKTRGSKDQLLIDKVMNETKWLDEWIVKPLSANPTKWSTTNCLSVFDHFAGLPPKGLSLCR